MKKIVFGLLLVVSYLLLVNSAWSVPMYINVQGKLTPVPPRDMQMRFKIYQGGSETTPGAQMLNILELVGSGIKVDESGVFNYNLPISGITGEFTQDDYYLGMQVGTDAEMRPLQRLVAVPLAIMAKNLDDGFVDAAGNPAVKGTYSSITYAVLGKSDSILKKHYGVFGAARESSPGTNYGVAGEGKSYGIYGTSEAGIGVYGVGVNAGGSFESYNGHGIVGISRSSSPDKKAGIYGITTQNSAFGVYGQSTAGYGIHGIGNIGVYTEGSGEGIAGAALYAFNYHLTDGIGVNGAGKAVGVFGESDGTAGVGVKGKFYASSGNYNGAGGSFESSGNYGLRGNTSRNSSTAYGIFGEATGSSTGVKGMSYGSGKGVWGYSTSGYGVYGTCTSGEAVKGSVENLGQVAVQGTAKSLLGGNTGTGVLGFGNIGVRGKGSQAGGSFECSATYGISLYAKNTSTSNYAIVGEITNTLSTSPAVIGESAGEGVAVHGENTGTGAGVYARSTRGPALEIGPSGWLKMPVVRGSLVSGMSSITVNSNSGIIDSTGTSPPHGWITVYCDKVRSSNAVVLTTLVNGVGATGARNIGYPTTGRFDIYVPGSADVAFFVINP